MKRCPTCNRVETDRSLAFCRVDGARLRTDSDSFESSTVVLPSETTTAELPKEQVHQSPSIAVLAFVNMSADSENEYFCDGLAEELINALTKIENLKVAARTSAFSFKGKNVDVNEIGRALHVSSVLEGSVRKSGNRLRITVQLINTADGYHLWSERYDREIQEVFDLQEEIASEICQKLRVQLTNEQRKQLGKRHTENPEAFQAYLKGRYYWNKRTEESLKRSTEYFQQAVALDPAYALAYAGLADSFALSGIAEYGFLSPTEAMPRAKEAAARALQLDDTLAEAQTTLAHVRAFYDWDWPNAEQDFKRAIALDPNYAFSHHWYALYLAAMKRHAEALEEETRAQEIDPYSLIINKNVGTIIYYGGQLDRSIEQYRKALDMESEFARTHLYLGLSYTQKGKYEEGIAEYQEALRIAGEGTVLKMLLGHAHALAGDRREATRLVDELKVRSEEQYVPAFCIAMIHAALGENDLAFEWLDRAFAERSSWLVYLDVEPMLGSLRSDARFEDLARRVGLPR